MEAIPAPTLVAVAAAAVLVAPAASASVTADGAPPAASSPPPAAPSVPEAVPGIREEKDGSTTVLGPVHDRPGSMTRFPLPQISEATDGKYEGGVFLRSWSEDGRQLVTWGTYVVDPGTGETLNLNQYAVEGARGLRDAVVDAAQRDAVPAAVNVLPHAVNYAQPSSPVLVFALAVGAGVGTAVLSGALAAAGFGELAQTVAGAAVPVALSPVFGGATGYPYHQDPVEGEVYRDFPPVYVWNVVQRAGGTAVYEGSYLTRYGDYQETTYDRGQRRVADAWKRVVVGTATRVDGETERLPGPYLRQDIHRDYDGRGEDSYEATQTISSGVFDDEVGESPGPAVRLDEEKEGHITAWADEQEDTVSVGVRVDGETYVPLLGTRTESRHWRYTDVTNLGAAVPAIETHRVTSYGVFAADEDTYVPVAGFDYWGERAPPDLWAFLFVLGLRGLGDQRVGDWQTRVGTFNHEGEFVGHAGARYDDDFQDHLWSRRGMVSAGLFQTNPLDPGDRRPGEAPDGARYVPLVGSTYDSPTGSTAWALADVGDNPDGMEPWRVSTGTFAGSRGQYIPLVGAEHRPEGYHGARAEETYRAGVFAGDYRSFVPLAGTTYDGEQTSGSWALRAAGSHAGLLDREGSFRTTQGVYGPDGQYRAVTGVDYEPRGTDEHAYGHEATVGAYEPEAGAAGLDGDFQPLVAARLGLDGPAVTAAERVGTCDASAEATLVPAGETAGASSPVCAGVSPDRFSPAGNVPGSP